MRCQHARALLDGGYESLGQMPALDSADQGGDRVVPGLRRHLLVDAGVRQDLGITFPQRDENEHTGAALRLVQPARDELAHRLAMGAIAFGARWDDAEPDPLVR